MAYNRAIFVIAFLSAALNPLANGQTLDVQGLSVTGRLCCTPTGNCPGQGANGALVSLNCTIFGANVIVGRAITSANGFFNITVPAVTGLVLGLPTIPCVAAVQLPLSNLVCPVLSTANGVLASALSTTTGVLASALQSVGTMLTATLGLVQNFALTGFLRLAV